MEQEKEKGGQREENICAYNNESKMISVTART